MGISRCIRRNPRNALRLLGGQLQKSLLQANCVSVRVGEAAQHVGNGKPLRRPSHFRTCNKRLIRSRCAASSFGRLGKAPSMAFRFCSMVHVRHAGNGVATLGCWIPTSAGQHGATLRELLVARAPASPSWPPRHTALAPCRLPAAPGSMRSEAVRTTSKTPSAPSTAALRLSAVVLMRRSALCLLLGDCSASIMSS